MKNFFKRKKKNEKDGFLEELFAKDEVTAMKFGRLPLIR